MNHTIRAGIAGRLRNLLDGEDLAAAANRLAVSELSLRMSVDEMSPHPTIEVIAAVVRHYGVDPAYLLTGVYDPASHRKVMDADTAVICDIVRQHLQGAIDSVIVSRPTPEPSTLRTVTWAQRAPA